VEYLLLDMGRIYTAKYLVSLKISGNVWGAYYYTNGASQLRTVLFRVCQEHSSTKEITEKYLNVRAALRDLD
jgi:hypothetical protein